MAAGKKILVIRLSSLGDVIYTTPVVRCLRQQLPGAEIHFLTKEQFAPVYRDNPRLGKLLLLREKLGDTIAEIKSERYDYIVDLHNNLRTFLIKSRTGTASFTYKKQPFRKWLSLKLRKNLMPDLHLVDRYLRAVKPLGIVNDNRPVDYPLNKSLSVASLLPEEFARDFVAFIIGAAHETKRLPNEKVAEICAAINRPVVLLGGKDVFENGEKIRGEKGAHIFNGCGKFTLDESVFLTSKATRILGFDTGLTHIAEAFGRPIASIWGSTRPELLGVMPYHVPEALVVGVDDLGCRPCSKYGLAKCPLGHFRCMWDIDNRQLIDFANAR